MLNIPYVDDSVVYNSVRGTVLFHGKELPATKELMERAKDQAETGEILNRWIAIHNDDLLKIQGLSSILENDLLIYDLFSNRDRARFANELYDMNHDFISFNDQNRDYFNHFSNYVVSNLKDTKSFIENEEDISFSNMVSEFISFNRSKLEGIEHEEIFHSKK